MRAPPERDDLQLVSQWLAGFCLRAERFTAAETRSAKTPDFRVIYDDRLVAYCEVKSPHDEWLDDRLDAAADLEIVGGTRPDPVFNRLAGHINKAAQQFEAANPDRQVPNILAFVNWDDASCFRDLIETLTGLLPLEGGRLEPTMMRIAKGDRIGSRKHQIDLYVWFDGQCRHQPKLFFGSEPRLKQELCGWLNVDPAAISPIGS